jgi:hypothetical protein
MLVYGKWLKGMEVFFDIIKRGKLKIQLSVQENHGCSVIFTASDERDRRILKAPILHNGKIKIYPNAQAAISDAMNKLTSPE